MPAASMLALHRNIVLGDSESLAGGRFFSGGARSPIKLPKKLLVLDDSLLSGKQMSATKSKLAGSKVRIDYACMYIKPGMTRHVDYFHKQMPTPRIFEWNVFHGYWMKFACVDIDGVLCPDPLKFENDDGPNYERFLKTTLPRRQPTVRIATLVTSRLEKYRPQTTRWLARYGIEYDHLIMHPAKTAQERRNANDHAERKAVVYKDARYKLFVESSERQAKTIYRICNKPVLCTDVGTLHA